MTFEHLWILPLLVLPVVWVVWEWPRASRHPGLLLKGFTLLLVLLALSEPVLPVWETRMAVAVLVDTSSSVTDDDLAGASEIVRKISEARGGNQVRVIPFAGSPRPPYAGEAESGWRFRHTAGPSGRATNLETAILDAMAMMPSDRVPRIVLISDGNENHGSIARVLWQATETGVPIDVYPMAGRKKPELRLVSVSYPADAFAGERFPIDLVLHSPRSAPAKITITTEGRALGTRPVQLSAGENQVRVYTRLNTGGAFDIDGVVEAEGLGQVHFAQAVAIHGPKLLYISDDPPGTGVHLFRALAASRFQIDQKNEIPREGLRDYQVIILNNRDLEKLSREVKTSLEKFITAGGGLLVIGGERNVRVENQRKQDDPLERALPATLAPPRSPEGTCVVIVIDKSSSMEGRKMELARLSAIGVVENLRPVDRVGVLMFDNSFQWTVPIRRAEDKSLIKRLISGIVADGGTQIAPALAEAYRRALPVKATYKHIVLLTDGISEEGNSIALAREAANRHVTISTVGLGEDVNKSYLRKIALYAEGKAYFLSDPSGLAQVLLRDVMEHTGHTAVEKPVKPIVARQAEILDGVPMEKAPPLGGYIRFKAKPTAETILKFASKDPLFVRWQYGLGRSAVFASDAKSRWAKEWVAWSGFDRFWVNVVRDLLPHAATSDARLTLDRATGELVAEYRLGPDVVAPDPLPEVYVFGPGEFRKPLNLHKVAARTYRARIPIGSRQGLFRVRAVEDSPAFPETGIYLQEDELNDFGANEALLRRTAAWTGGHFEPDVRDIFQTGGQAIATTMMLWPGLLLLAILLNLTELIVRKWKGLTAAVRRRG